VRLVRSWEKSRSLFKPCGERISRAQARRKHVDFDRESSCCGPLGCGLTLRWSGRVEDKVPSPNRGARAAQLNR